MIALVTGANKGIGLEVARQLALQGHQVILTSRDVSKGQTALASIAEAGEIHYHQLDVTDQASIEAVYDYVQTTFGRLDILVNNAGINYDTWHTALNADLDNVRETFEANLFGPWAMIQAFIPMMQTHNYGRIVNVSSGAGAIQGMGSGTPGYAISKAGLNILTLKAASLVGRANILINSVCPGWVRTDMGGAGASRSVAQGAETIVWAAQLEDGGPNGLFFRDKKQIPF